MITLPNGNTYELLFLDTNALSEFTNNTNDFCKNFLLKYLNGQNLFVVSYYNILELYKTEIDFKVKIKDSLGLIPLGILKKPETLFMQEKTNNNNEDDYNLIDFVIGHNAFFNNSINSLFDMLENPKMQYNLSTRYALFNKELNEWQKKRKNPNSQWQKQFKQNLINAMKGTVASFIDLEVDKYYDNYKALKIYALIKNMFINNYTKELKINSIIDSYNAAYLPYINIYITERTVGSWLNEAKGRFPFIQKKEIIKLSNLFS